MNSFYKTCFGGLFPDISQYLTTMVFNFEVAPTSNSFDPIFMISFLESFDKSINLCNVMILSTAVVFYLFINFFY